MIGVCVEKSLRGRNAHLSAAQKAAPIEVTQKLRTNPDKYTNTLSANRGHSKTPKQILANTQIHFRPIEVIQIPHNKSWKVHKYIFGQ